MHRSMGKIKLGIQKDKQNEIKTQKDCGIVIEPGNNCMELPSRRKGIHEKLVLLAFADHSPYFNYFCCAF